MIYLITGRRELGKTTLARYLAKKRQPELIIDPRAQWPRETAVDLEDARHAEGALIDLIDRMNVIVQPVNDVQEAVDYAAWVAKSFINGVDDPESPHAGRPRELSVIFDEARLYSLRSWSYVFRCSPRERTSLILTSHRPKDIETDVRAIADYWSIFRTVQAHDLEVIEERCGPDVVDAVKKLKPYEFVTWDDAKASWKLHDNPAAWQVPADVDLVGRDVNAHRGLF